ncbi:MAG TPA: phosphate ABC transporter substrate-binding protein [Candidatus Avoscillospira avistercoris]|uniref:Phosphate-binding protein n=1 Tax=Candidatus Avoscillospira avistercoris TaxID=2840707 RepID=A0A9D1F899_9FIRM|nr:phosphate ABC transporter substrate-binding protein [Candidatus Avoscillospira avistercoris]
MKKFVCLALSLMTVLAMFTGCGSKTETPAEDTAANNENNAAATENTPAEDTAAEETNGTTEALSGTVNTDGSTSMNEMMLIMMEVFEEMNPDVTVNYSGTGSGAGIEAVLNETVDIGLASRALKDEEKANGAVEHIVALDGVAVVVNPDNSVTDLTVDQIAQIYKGEVTNWSELGGADQEIAVLGREDGSGTRSAFEEIVGVDGECKYTNEYSSTGDVIGQVASNPGAIGYASLSAVDETVAAVKVDGVAPSEETVKDGSYTLQRPFVMVTKDGVELSAAAQGFLDFVMSDEAAQYITMAGVVAP